MSNQNTSIVEALKRRVRKSAHLNGFGRLSLDKGAVSRLQSNSGFVRVVSGCAWLTIDDKDYILCKGEESPLPPSRFPILISGMGKSALVYEIV